MRARIHILGTDRVVWRPADEAAEMVAAGQAEYAGNAPAVESARPQKPAPKPRRR